ncbi:unnamed protein product (macronuclear) [Paramecium tetraurelia]|uniref:Uncharacterized protein n=1 Tax=Paramecium tetraurelia TaxID=5888 RepID=A0BR52_PARTE|nr:uncharacterized protein GSPATT00031248001 [Paramecium tetraurelia]CAK61019.1 unnamed protein product [Paramecium tetraurelia]|eukprot:XP_001428417.1 hypothetical protein (macronuclear) [Paramecium tetraurelia strain d4-2]
MQNQCASHPMVQHQLLETAKIYTKMESQNKKINLKILWSFLLFVHFVSLLMVLHQHLVVQIVLFVYGRQDRIIQSWIRQQFGSRQSQLFHTLWYYISNLWQGYLFVGCQDRQNKKPHQMSFELCLFNLFLTQRQHYPLWDGTQLASCSNDNSIRKQNVKTEQQKPNQMSIQMMACLVCFSPDGTTLASCTQDNSIRLWNFKTVQQILSENNCYNDILVQFSPEIYNNTLILESGIYFSLLFSYLQYYNSQKFHKIPFSKPKMIQSLKGNQQTIQAQIQDFRSNLKEVTFIRYIVFQKK